MKKVLGAFGVLTAIFLVGLYWATRRNEKPLETMKALAWFCVVNGCGWVWSSYILAYLGREEIAESLSKVALTEIIAVIGVYAAKAVIEQLSKNNMWPDKPVKKEDSDHVGL